MKNILRSAIIVLAIAVAVGGATSAFFTDTETTATNTLTAGAIDLTVGSTATYNGAPAAAGTWAATNLGAEKLFALSDVKPGDYGTNAIALTVSDNDAYARLRLTKDATKDVDVTCTEPETADDASCGATANGDLDDITIVWFWNDTDGDGAWGSGEAAIVAPTTLASLGASAQYGIGGTDGILADTTEYVGFGWCVGTVSGTTEVNPSTCNGAAVSNNAAQTDTYGMTFAFDVVQQRHNTAMDFGF